MPSTGLAILRRASRVCAELSRAWAVRRAASASSNSLSACRPTDLSKLLRALEGLLRVGHRRPVAMSTSACCRSGSTVNSGAPGLQRVALAHRQRLDAAGLVGATKIRSASIQPWYPGSLAFEQARERQQGGSRSLRTVRFHGALSLPSSMSKCARIIARTSSGSKRSNRPLQIDRDDAGREEELGKRTSASVLSSPRSIGAAQHARGSPPSRAR